MKWLDLLFAARPLLHLPVWSVYLVSLHYHLDLSGETAGIRDLLVMICLSLLSAGTYYLNQVYDRESDRINGKLAFLERGYLTERELLGGFLVASTAGLLIASSISFVLMVVVSQLFVLGYLYSVPPFRLKDRPFWGLVANAYAYGFLVPLTVMPDLTEHNAGLLGWDSPVYFALAVGSIYLLTTLPDREGDRATGKRTLAAIWPGWAVKGLAMVLMAGAIAVAVRSGLKELTVIGSIALLFILLAAWKSSQTGDLLAAKLPILLLTLLAGWYFPVYLVFVLVLILLTRVYYSRRFNVVYPRIT